MEHKNVFGSRVRKLRLEKQLSQGDLGRMLGYSDRSAIAKIEAGKNTVSTEKLKEFAKALNTTTSYLLGALEDDLYVLGVSTVYTESGVTLKDEMSSRELRLSKDQWRAFEERNDFKAVWELLGQKETPAPVEEDKRSAIQIIFDQLTPANQSKLLELADLYLNQQHRTEET